MAENGNIELFKDFKSTKCKCNPNNRLKCTAYPTIGNDEWVKINIRCDTCGGEVGSCKRYFK